MFKRLPHLSVAVLGSGPRALASAICLSRHHTVRLGDTTGFRQQRTLAHLPLYPGESRLDDLLRQNPSHVELTGSHGSALLMADIVVVAEQPVFRASQRRFDMSAIERCLQAVARQRPRATVILEAPAPVGYAVQASLQHRLDIIPAPLVLREGQVMRDRLQAPRIVVGSDTRTGSGLRLHGGALLYRSQHALPADEPELS